MIKELSNIPAKKIELEKKPYRSIIVSMGPRLSIFHKQLRANEIFYFRHFLLNFYGRKEVHYATKLLKEDKIIPYFKDIWEVNLNDYDEVFIHNSSINFFGGAVSDYTQETFKKLTEYNGNNLWFYITDPKFNWTDYGQMFKERMAKGTLKFPNNILTEEMLNKFSKEIFPKPKCLYIGNDYAKLKIEKNTKNSKGSWKPYKMETLTEWAFIETCEFWAANIVDSFEESSFPREFDITYFGNNRNTDRNRVLDSYFKRDTNLKKYWIGYDPQYENCTALGYVSRDILFKELKKVYATLVLGDKEHYGNIRTIRLFEALMNDMIAFVYEPYDGGYIIENKELRSFIIVNNINELKEKLEKYKNDEKLFRHILTLQKQEFQKICGKWKLPFKLEMEKIENIINKEQKKEKIKSLF